MREPVSDVQFGWHVDLCQFFACVSFSFPFFQGSLLSGRSKVTRATVGRITNQSFRVCEVNLATLKKSQQKHLWFAKYYLNTTCEVPLNITRIDREQKQISVKCMIVITTEPDGTLNHFHKHEAIREKSMNKRIQVLCTPC